MDQAKTAWASSVGIVTGEMIDAMRRRYKEQIGEAPKFLVMHPQVPLHPQIPLHKGIEFEGEWTIFGMQIIWDRNCPRDTIFLTTEPPKEGEEFVT